MTHQSLVRVAGHPLFLRMTQRKETEDLDQLLRECSEEFRSIRDHYINTNLKIIDSLNVNYQPHVHGSETSANKELFFGAYDPSVHIIQTLERLIRDNLELPKLSLSSSKPANVHEYYAGLIAWKRLQLAGCWHERALKIYLRTLLNRQISPVVPSEYPAKLS